MTISASRLLSIVALVFAVLAPFISTGIPLLVVAVVLLAIANLL